MRLIMSRMRGDSGAAAIELGILLPVLMLLLTGLFDLGFGGFYKMQLQAAVAAGARYALVNGFSSGPIAAVVQGATGTSPITAATSEFCGCPTDPTPLQQQGYGQPSPTLGCSSPSSGTDQCVDGSIPNTYAQITAQYSYNTVLPYPGLPQPFVLSAQAVTPTH